MKVLIACEFSGIVRDAFAARGHDVWSCDLLSSERPGNHIQGDVLEVLGDGWDLMVAHPPCTYLCNMGIWWNHKRPERWAETDKASKFFMQLADADIPRIAIENPVGTMSTKWRKPEQVINPWQFGHEANKPTCLWLKGLPRMTPTNIVGKGQFYGTRPGRRWSAWMHKTSGMRKTERARIASRTFQGIAEAMAEQWSASIPPAAREAKGMNKSTDLEKLRSYIGSRLLVLGDHPHAGKAVDFIDVRMTPWGMKMVARDDCGQEFFLMSPSEYKVIRKDMAP